MLYKLYLYLMKKRSADRLDVFRFVVGDSVIIKLYTMSKGLEYFGVIGEISMKEVMIVGKPLCWVLNGDLKFDKYTFYLTSIESIEFYTRELASDAKERAKTMLETERLDVIVQSPPLKHDTI